MIFRITFFLLAIIVPFSIYYVYLKLYFHKQLHTRYQKLFLSLACAASLILSIGYMVYLSQQASDNINGQFVPAKMGKDGKIINSHIL